MLTDIGDVSPSPLEEEVVFRIPNARVVCANYHALVQDFPHVFGEAAIEANPLPGCDRCAKLGRLCRKMVNLWILDNAAFISEQQLSANAVNSTICVDAHARRQAYRPPEYGRAVIVPVDSANTAQGARYLDLKGIGVGRGREPKRGYHSNGLEYLGDALADFFYGWLIDSIFARSCPGYQVLPVYAVLDLGFDIFSNDRGPAPAGMHVRRAHTRPDPLLPMSGSDHEKLTIHIEMLLRHFGLTSATYGTALRVSGQDSNAVLTCLGQQLNLRTEGEKQKAANILNLIGSGGFAELSMCNIQLASDMNWDTNAAQLYDLGHFTAARKFETPFANKIRDAALGIGRIVMPDDALFVQPAPKVRIDPELCARDSVNAYCFYAADQFRHSPRQFNQKRIERSLRIARVKAFGRSLDLG